MKERDLTKLPKWAANQIVILERKLIAAEDALRQIGRQDSTNVFIEETLKEPVPLPKDSRIRFTHDGETKYFTVYKTKDECRLYIYASYGSLIVRPQASNVVTVEIERW